MGAATTDFNWSQHAAVEADADGLLRAEVETAVKANGRVIEDYPDDPRGASALLLANLENGDPIHVVLGFRQVPTVVITVYRPDPAEWDETFSQRKEGAR